MSETPEQRARDLLERIGVEDAQSFTAGDVLELANLIARQPSVTTDVQSEQEQGCVSMETLNSVTVAGARAFWALKDLETKHEALRADVLTVVSDPHLAWDEARTMLMAALAVPPPPPVEDGREQEKALETRGDKRTDSPLPVTTAGENEVPPTLLNACSFEALMHMSDALETYAEWNGGVHDDLCPEDDTCDCSRKWVNDGVNSIVRMLRGMAEARKPQGARPVEDGRYVYDVETAIVYERIGTRLIDGEEWIDLALREHWTQARSVTRALFGRIFKPYQPPEDGSSRSSAITPDREDR